MHPQSVGSRAATEHQEMDIFCCRTTMGLNRTSPLNRSSFTALGRGPGGNYIWGPPGAVGEDPFIPHSRHPPSSESMRANRPIYPQQPSAAAAPSSSSSRRSARHEGVDFRKNVYRQNLWARPNPEQDRIRESSPEFYRYVRRTLSLYLLHNCRLNLNPLFRPAFVC